MTSPAHDMLVTIDIADGDMDFLVTYNYTPGRAMIQPSLSQPGEPEESAEVEVVSITTNDTEVPQWFLYQVVDYVEGLLIERHHQEAEHYSRDAAIRY